MDKLNSRNAFHVGMAGWGGTASSLLFLVLSVALFVMHSVTTNFLSLTILSIAFLVFMSGERVFTLFLSIGRVLISSKHSDHHADNLVRLSSLLDQTVVHMDNKSSSAEKFEVFQDSLKSSPGRSPELESVISAVRENPNKCSGDEDYAISDARRIYLNGMSEYSSVVGCLEYVANSMPLFGLIMTLVDMFAIMTELNSSLVMEELGPKLGIAFSCTLFGAVLSAIYKVVESRFADRIRDLDFRMDSIENAMLSIRREFHECALPIASGGNEP
jgi:hypothetical protein